MASLNAPELAEGSLLGVEEFAEEAGIAASSCSRRAASQRRYEAVTVIVSEGRSVQLACRVLGVSASGYYDW